MATATKRVVFRGVPVDVVEGDLLVTRWKSYLSYFLGAFNDGMSHVTTATAIDGQLVCVSPCPFDFKDAQGHVWKAGIDPRPMELLNDPACLHLYLVRPASPRTPEANVAARLLCAQQIAENKKHGSLYESGVGEFLVRARGRPVVPNQPHTRDPRIQTYTWAQTTTQASFFGWAQATKKKFHCAEFAACLRRTAGLWPAKQTVSVTVPHLVKTVGGSCMRIF